jgi:hypothetical protein
MIYQNSRRRFRKMKVSRFVYWTPRIVSILFIIFLAMFSLDIISPGLSLIQIIIGLFMHNIPVFVLLIVLIISWKYEIVGGIAFILAGLLYITLVFVRSGVPWYIGLSWSVTIAGPAFLAGILFMVNWYKKKQ